MNASMTTIVQEKSVTSFNICVSMRNALVIIIVLEEAAIQ